MPIDEVHAALFLNALRSITPRRFQGLIRKFGSARDAVQAGPENWIEIDDVDAAVRASVKFQWADGLKDADEDRKAAERLKAQIYMWQEGPYPSLLKEISDAPPIIYALGDDLVSDAPRVALVGSRRCSYYGEKVARMLAVGLAEAGVITVSGLARGVDTHVHKGSLEMGGKTWAVIGCGLNEVYPPENKDLAKRIEKAGAVISEFPMLSRPFPGNFPRRNRLIAGLSSGTVVVEGGMKSGSLITARLAAIQGRDVFAVPGPITSPLSAAPHLLIEQGARLVSGVDDILSELGLKSRPGNLAQAEPLISAYAPVMAMIGFEPVPREIIAEKLTMDAAVLSAILLDMELKGLVRFVEGGALVKC